MSLNVISFIAPAVMLTSGMLIGITFSRAPIKMPKNKTLLTGVFAIVSAALLIILALLYQAKLASIYTFGSFVALVKALPYANAIGNSAPMAAIILIVILEIGLTSGFAIAIKLSQRPDKSATSQNITSEELKATARNAKTASVPNSQTTANAIMTKSQAPAIKDTTAIAEGQSLTRDEQSIMELFLYGKVTQIIPVADSAKPGGYYFKGMPQLGWDTKRSRQVLESLVGKGFLKAELTDEVIICKSCGSADVRLKRACPDCGSLKLRKEGLIEHFSCGAVERQDSFQTQNGDLVCPKCKAKLRLIGSDYRKLPPAYRCLQCNNLSSEPSLIVKCRDCDTSADMHEQPEMFLYAYSLNSGLPVKEMQQIKPVEACVRFFKSLGYTIVTPALVSGRSGTQHQFDILVLGKVGWIEAANAKSLPITRRDNGNTVVELLISGSAIDTEEITRIYGMISDVECDAITFAIPSLTESARNYASAYNLKICEGQSVDEALAKSKIPHAVSNEAET